MSFSVCIKCERMVSMYEKYCDECIHLFGLQQDEDFHKRVILNNWDKQRKEEFEKDLQRANLFKS